MEEAEHALWRAAGLSIGKAEETGGWPRVSAAFDFKSPLRFEDEFDVAVTLTTVTRRSIQYGFTITCRDTLIGTGTMTAVCTQKEGGQLHAVDLPEGLVDRLRQAAEAVRLKPGRHRKA